MRSYLLENLNLSKSNQTYSLESLYDRIRKEVRLRRIEKRETQRDFASNLNIPLPTYRCFEQTGEIPFKYFLKIVLDLKGADSLIQSLSYPAYKNIDDISAKPKQRIRK